ncbi:MAG: phospholipid carrier-dependent glycosyltransferase [bacterium]
MQQTKKDILIVFILISFLFLQAILSMRLKSNTFDEVNHIICGYTYIKTKEFRLTVAHPPLIKELAAIPLLLLRVKLPNDPEAWEDCNPNLYGKEFLYQFNDADTMLFWSRLVIVCLAGLLGIFVFIWAKELYGRRAALLALFLFCFCPDILAHAQLVTTDLGLSCFFFIACYFFYRFERKRTPITLLFTGISLGLALLSKFSALFILPIWTIIIIYDDVKYVFSTTKQKRQYESLLKRMSLSVLSLILICLVALFIIWLGYGGKYSKLKVSNSPSCINRPWEIMLPSNKLIKESVLFFKKNKIIPEAFLYGLLHTIKVTDGGRSFLMGKVSRGWWYYFIITFLIKTPIPLLIFLLLVIISSHMDVNTSDHFIVIPVIIFFLIAILKKFNIGHRHILPIYPFLFVYMGKIVNDLKFKWQYGILTLLLFWYLIGTLKIFPDYLAYFNELIGGPDNGYHYVVDSSLDWGQDLKGLKSYMEKKGIKKIFLSYFGTASPEYYKINYEPLPSFFSLEKPMKLFSIKSGDFIAISVTNLQGVYLNNYSFSERILSYLKTLKPIGKIGYSIHVYQMP